MSKTTKTAAAIAILLAASGCDWRDTLYSLAMLQTGVIIVDYDDDDNDGCDEWYDFADPGCY